MTQVDWRDDERDVCGVSSTPVPRQLRHNARVRPADPASATTSQERRGSLRSSSRTGMLPRRCAEYRSSRTGSRPAARTRTRARRQSAPRHRQRLVVPVNGMLLATGRSCHEGYNGQLPSARSGVRICRIARTTRLRGIGRSLANKDVTSQRRRVPVLGNPPVSERSRFGHAAGYRRVKIRSWCVRFGVGLANFSGGRDRQPREIVAAIADALPVIDSYGHTGNVALEDGDMNEVGPVLEAVTGRACTEIREQWPGRSR